MVVPAPQVIPHERTALREHLESVPVGFFHGVEYAVDEWRRNVLVEQVAHGIDEDLPRSFPCQRLFHSFRAQCQIEALLVWVPRHPSEPFRETLSVAIGAPLGNFGAPGYRIPGGVSPFDAGVVAHGDPRVSLFVVMVGRSGNDADRRFPVAV